MRKQCETNASSEKCNSSPNMSSAETATAKKIRLQTVKAWANDTGLQNSCLNKWLSCELGVSSKPVSMKCCFYGIVLELF